MTQYSAQWCKGTRVGCFGYSKAVGAAISKQLVGVVESSVKTLETPPKKLRVVKETKVAAQAQYH